MRLLCGVDYEGLGLKMECGKTLRVAIMLEPWLWAQDVGTSVPAYARLYEPWHEVLATIVVYIYIRM